MPQRSWKPCTYPGCTMLSQAKDGRCPVHPHPVWVKKNNPDRLRGPPLQKERRALFKKHPLCVLCQAMDPPRVSLAVQRDHIIPLGEGGKEVRENTQALCKECHDKKSKEEWKRGLERYRKNNG